MKSIIFFLIFQFVLFGSNFAQNFKKSKMKFFSAENPSFQYIGRFDFTNPKLPKVWAPGAHVQTTFKGNSVEISINDEVLWGNSHNYISVVIDNQKPKRIKLKGKENSLLFEVENKKLKIHTLFVCKGTESGIGYIEFVGVNTEKLLKPTNLPTRKIEFIGNSITCGTGSNTSEFPCGTGQWYDQHDAYMSYGAQTARLLQADWVQTSVSGIGLIHSCCDMKIVMPDVIENFNLHEKNNPVKWNMKKYQPDVLTIALGQNDGIQDSSTFCSAYIQFIKRMRSYYPHTSIICLTSPMADEKLVSFMKNTITNIVQVINKEGDNNVSAYFFSKQYHAGCGEHPSLDEHTEIAKELSEYIKKIKNW